MRIGDKIKEIETFLEELISFLPVSFEEYKNNSLVKSACERHFEKIVEAVIDLAFLVVKERNLGRAEDDKVVFDVLADKKVISQELGERLKDAKGMRNILAHAYGTVDDEVVFHSIAEELEKDVNNFVKEVKKAIIKEFGGKVMSSP